MTPEQAAELIGVLKGLCVILFGTSISLLGIWWALLSKMKGKD